MYHMFNSKLIIKILQFGQHIDHFCARHWFVLWTSCLKLNIYHQYKYILQLSIDYSSSKDWYYTSLTIRKCICVLVDLFFPKLCMIHASRICHVAWNWLQLFQLVFDHWIQCPTFLCWVCMNRFSSIACSVHQRVHLK